MRTVKSCGSDAPGPASSLREDAQATVSTKPGHREEREVSRKTIARGMPGCSGVTVVTMLVCFFICTRGCGRIARPAFPAPSDIKGTRNSGKTRAESRGEIADLCVGNTNAPRFHLSSPGLTGRPSIPEASVIEPKGRGVLDTPLARGMTVEGGAAACPRNDELKTRALTSADRSNAGSGECPPPASGSRAACWRGPRRASAPPARSPRRPSAGRCRAASEDENHGRRGWQR